MSYPASQRTARLLIEAALEWEAARSAPLITGRGIDAHMGSIRAKDRRVFAAEVRLTIAVLDHRATTATAHVQGPNIDGDVRSTP